MQATPRGVAVCPGCGDRLRAKCGAARKQIWHWAHIAKDCDAWHEPEGEWHLGWKLRAPPACTEVVMGPHRADIRCQDGLVIELQASYIDTIELRAREAFYDRMIWLLDGRALAAAGRFRCIRGRYRRCETCRILVNGRAWKAPACEGKACGYDGMIVDLALGDRYAWKRGRSSFDGASRPVYVDMGDSLFSIEGPPNAEGFGRLVSYAEFCAVRGLTYEQPALDEVARD